MEALPLELPPIPNQIQALCTSLMPWQRDGFIQKRGTVRWKAAAVPGTLQEKTLQRSGCCRCFASPHPRKATENPALAGPGLGACPGALLPSCSFLVNFLRIRAVFSRAGEMSGLYQRGHRNHNKPSGPILRPEPPPLVTSLSPGTREEAVAQGTAGQVSFTFPGLCSCHTPTT